MLGDFQETVTSTAVVNWGAYTKEPAPDGLVAYLLPTHHLIVRTDNPFEQYITR